MKKISYFVLMSISILFYSPYLSYSQENSGGQSRKDRLQKISNAIQKQDHPEAIKLLDAWISAEPKEADAYATRAMIFEQLKKLESAQKDCNKAIELNDKNAGYYDQRGGVRFKLGDVKGSLQDFDKAIELAPKRAENHWRRGISLYYLGRFADGAKQFELGKKVYANDVENAFWHYLCLARAESLAQARKQLLAIGRDARIPMMAIYDLIQGKLKDQDILDQINTAKLSGEDKKEASFYAYLYLALHAEADQRKADCQKYLEIAVKKYPISHYMWDVANVHLKLLQKNQLKK